MCKKCRCNKCIASTSHFLPHQQLSNFEEEVQLKVDQDVVSFFDREIFFLDYLNANQLGKQNEIIENQIQFENTLN